jgi:hypothetical protein
VRNVENNRACIRETPHGTDAVQFRRPFENAVRFGNGADSADWVWRQSQQVIGQICNTRLSDEQINGRLGNIAQHFSDRIDTPDDVCPI